MKKIISLLLCLVFSVALFPAVYADAPEVYIKVKDLDQIIYEGTEFEVSVCMDDIPTELFSYLLVVEYDPEYLEYISCDSPDDEGIEGMVTNDSEAGTVLYSYSRLDYRLEEVLANIKFKVLQEGETTLSIDAEKSILASKANNEDVELEFATTDFDLNIGVVPDKPTIKSSVGSFNISSSTKFTMSADEGCKIYYTTNGDEPTTEDKLYSKEKDVYLSKSCTIKAIAVKYGIESDVTSKKVTYIPPSAGGGGSSGSSSSGGGWNNIVSGSQNYAPVVTPAPTPTPEKYTDIKGHWAYDHINTLINKGIINGYEDGTVRPDNYVTRNEAAKIISAAIGYGGANEITLTFADTAEIPDWAKPWVQTAVNAGFVTGYEDNTFRPSQNVSRKELAVMAMRAFGFGTDDLSLTFNDASTIPDWAAPYISKAVSLSIITGYEDNTFLPDRNVTRAEVCAIIAKCLNK